MCFFILNKYDKLRAKVIKSVSNKNNESLN